MPQGEGVRFDQGIGSNQGLKGPQAPPGAPSVSALLCLLLSLHTQDVTLPSHTYLQPNGRKPFHPALHPPLSTSTPHPQPLHFQSTQSHALVCPSHRPPTCSLMAMNLSRLRLRLKM